MNRFKTFREDRANGIPLTKSFVKVLETEDFRNDGVDSQWHNKDLLPAPLEQRKWRLYNYVAFWWAASFAPAEWATGSSLVSAGLTFNQAMVSVVIGSALSGFAMVVTARPGAKLHIGYPTLLRSLFGMWGSKIFVGLRRGVAAIWFGIQTYYASKLLDVAFCCMFGHKWQNIPNTLPESADITFRELLIFFVLPILCQFVLDKPLIIVSQITCISKPVI